MVPVTDNFPSWLEDDGGSATSETRPGTRAATDDGGRSRRRKKKRRNRSVLALVIVALLIGLVALLVVFALQARTAYAEMRAAMPLVSELRQEALSGQAEAAGSTAEELREHTSAARDAVAGPHWALGAKLPWAGPNIEAVRTATTVVDDLAADALPDLVAATGVVDPARLAPQDGRIDLAPFADVAPRVVAANDAVLAGRDRLDTVDTDDLVGLLGDQIGNLKGQVDELAGLTATASRAVQLIPPMLGVDEPRDYILMVQNNAEPRSTGGLTGAFIHLRADDGAIELLDQYSAADVGYFGDGAVELTETEVALFGTQLARYPGNVTSTPDFPRSAEIIRAMWNEGIGGEVDGVLSLDPVALGSLLEATGPVGLDDDALGALGVPSDLFDDGEARLTADNAADIMLNGVYRYIDDTSAQDEFFEVAAGEIFSAVMDGEAAPAATVAALVAAGEEGRLLVWSAHEEEQELLSGTMLSGELRGDDGRGAPVVGVYVNDLSGAKIAYYQRMEVEMEAQQCHANGNQDLTLTITLSSDAPEGAAVLPPSLVGDGDAVDEGDMRSNLLVYAPTGGRITDMRDPDGTVDAFPQIHDGQVVAARRVYLSPGESVTTQVDITTGAGFTEDAVLRMTPGPGGESFVSSALTCRQ